MKRPFGQGVAGYLLNAFAVLLGVVFLLFIEQRAIAHRHLPAQGVGLFLVERQADVYRVLRSLDLRGAHVVQLNRFFNLEDYSLSSEMTTRPFPITPRDLRHVYEEGITSHNWLYIATRTGMVRKITSVLPDSIFDQRVPDLRADPSFGEIRGGFAGYSYDTPRSVFLLRTLRQIDEPVVAVIDAGFFVDGSDPGLVMSHLREKCPDIRTVVFVGSVDEPEVTDGMREQLMAFQAEWNRK